MSARRVLLVTWEGGGTSPPELAIARRLRARGHDVRVLGDACLDDDARALSRHSRVAAAVTSALASPALGEAAKRFAAGLPHSNDAAVLEIEALCAAPPRLSPR